MAALASSAVTLVRGWTEGSITGKNRKCWNVRLVLTGQGTSTNSIDAALFEMTTIEEVAGGVDNGDLLVTARPNYAGTKVLLYDVQNATDANRDDPADFTGVTVQLTVKGY
jgi:hypothetical protein